MLLIDIKRALKSTSTDAQAAALIPLSTKWGDEVRKAAHCSLSFPFTPRPEHPNPQFERDSFECLNGWWMCAFVKYPYNTKKSARGVCAHAIKPDCIDIPILVPFSPEAELSGVHRQLQSDELLWYRTEIMIPEEYSAAQSRCLLHFQAVDDTCAVWCNGVLLGTHEGGYLPFSFDMAPALDAYKGNRRAIIEVCVADPSDEGVQPRGKQKLSRGGIWHTAQSGIWQSVWMEVVPQDYLKRVHFDADVKENRLIAQMNTCGEGVVRMELWDGNSMVAQGSVHTNCEHAELIVHVPNPRFWHPDDPFLYRVVLRFDGVGGLVDTVQSYCAWRTAEVLPDGSGGSRFFLNGEPFFLKGVLDQGYWPESLMTAPSDEAIAFDIEQMKACGFNMLRKHVKIEDSRFYYHCDRLGMLVWQDMVNGGGSYGQMLTSTIPAFSVRSWHCFDDVDQAHTRQLGGEHRHYRDRWWKTCRQVLDCLGNHPCVITWSLFNEGWGQFDSAGFARLVREIDPTRPVEATSGWFDQGAGDYYGVHNYYREQKVFHDWRQRKWRTGRACIMSELGGFAQCVDGHAHVPRVVCADASDSLAQWRRTVKNHLELLDSIELQGLAGYVFAQVSDIEEEHNGILTADRAVNKMHA